LPGRADRAPAADGVAGLAADVAREAAQGGVAERAAARRPAQQALMAQREVRDVARDGARPVPARLGAAQPPDRVRQRGGQCPRRARQGGVGRGQRGAAGVQAGRMGDGGADSGDRETGEQGCGRSTHRSQASAPRAAIRAIAAGRRG